MSKKDLVDSGRWELPGDLICDLCGVAISSTPQEGSGEAEMGQVTAETVLCLECTVRINAHDSP